MNVIDIPHHNAIPYKLTYVIIAFTFKIQLGSVKINASG